MELAFSVQNLQSYCMASKLVGLAGFSGTSPVLITLWTRDMENARATNYGKCATNILGTNKYTKGYMI
jgi:hypothetical protein